MTPAFLSAFDRLIGHEGEFQNDPNDDGNWTGGRAGEGECRGTKYGISAASYPGLNIHALTLDDARRIYWRDYWLAVGAGKIPDEMGFQLFDAAVHHGPRRAITFVQKAVGAPADGVWGPQTESAFLLATARSAPAVMARFNGVRLAFMADTKRWPEFSKGWARRVAANLQAIR
jgi:lysozyme family protein